jgi:Domain of unknown function (DUF3402)
MLSPPRRAVTRSTVLPNGTMTHEEIDMLTEFSWRNFFFTINFAKVMQKLSKHRSHRIRMLVQYKSTVPSSSRSFYVPSNNRHIGRSQACLESATSVTSTPHSEINQESSSIQRA